MVVDSVEKLQVLIDVVNRTSEEKGLKKNRDKLERVVVSKRSEAPVCPVKIEKELVGKVEQF